MRILFTKLSDQRHAVRVERRDGSSETVELDSRSFLRHDLAHLAVERELGLAAGLWGSVAGGASLTGGGLSGSDMALAETLSGPMQTMMRTNADVDEVFAVLSQVMPRSASRDLAERLHEHLRSLAGHWAATPFGGEMELTWPSAPN